ncbi:MAG: TonB-dependent receptor plug domain-containing protein, partial [Sphingobacterium sp.]
AAFTVSRAEGSIEGVVEKANETTLLKLEDQQRDSTLSVKMVGEAGKLLKEAFGSNEIKIDTLPRVKANQASDFKKISRSDIDFSKDLKYFIDNKLISKAEFLAYPERKLAKYWFSNDNNLIKYKTKLAIDISGGAILASSVEMQQKQDIAHTKMRYFVDGVLQNPDFNVNDFDPNSIASMTVLEGSAAVNKYGDVGKNGVIELKLKEGANVGKKVTELRGNTIGITVGGNKPSDVLYVIDGVKVNSEDMKGVDPNNFESIHVLKDVSANVKYGEEGKNGVIEVTTKKWARENPDKVNKASHTLKSENNPDERVITVVGYKKGDKGKAAQKDNLEKPAKFVAQTATYANVGGESKNMNAVRIRGLSGREKPLFVVDGELKNNQFDLGNLNSSDILSVSINKNNSLTEMYGDRGGNGIVKIVTKAYAAKYPEKLSDLDRKIQAEQMNILSKKREGGFDGQNNVQENQKK